jgi:hypothetical protein
MRAKYSLTINSLFKAVEENLMKRLFIELKKELRNLLKW